MKVNSVRALTRTNLSPFTIRQKSAEFFWRMMGNKGKQEAGRATAADSEGFSLISNSKLIELYAGLVKYWTGARRMRTTARMNGSNRKPGLAQSQEAGAIGVAIDLTSRDFVLTAGSAPLGEMLKAIFPEGAHPLGIGAGAVAGTRQSRAASDEAEFHAALGAALAAKTKKQGAVIVVFGGVGADEAWNEAVHVARLHELPMVFVCHEKAMKAEQSGRRKPAEEPSDLPYLPHIPVDGNDVVAIYRVASESIGRARKGRGPTVIDCQDFPFGGSGAGKAGVKVHADALTNMETYLRNKGLFTRELKHQIAVQAAELFLAADAAGEKAH